MVKELVICSNASRCGVKDTCTHKTLHEHDSSCDIESCDRTGTDIRVACIPSGVINDASTPTITPDERFTLACQMAAAIVQGPQADGFTSNTLAISAYKVADALLAERDKRDKESCDA